jgi:quinol monooxygenase YgiN
VRERVPPASDNAVSKLAVIGTIEVASGRRDQLFHLLVAHRARCLKDEPGIVLQFDILVPLEDDTKVLIYEVYRDDAAFDAHRTGPAIAQWRKESAGMIVKVVLMQYALLN